MVNKDGVQFKPKGLIFSVSKIARNTMLIKSDVRSKQKQNFVNLCTQIYHLSCIHMFVQLAMEMLRVKINFLSIILSQLVGRCLMSRLKELKTIIQAKVKLTAKVETKVNQFLLQAR